MRSMLIFCMLVAVINGCGSALDKRERMRLDSLIAKYANKPVHVLENTDTISYAYRDSTRQDTAFRLLRGQFYRLQQREGYPDKNGLVVIVLTEGCLWYKGYVHYSRIKELRVLK